MVIEIEASVKSNIERVWEYWTGPAHVEKWNQASTDWHCPKAINDLRIGGKFCYTMAAKDKSSSFDFGGVYSKVENNKLIEYVTADGRKVSVVFEKLSSGSTKIVEIFEAENVHPPERQKEGWGAILESFKSYCESS